jgi:hypothetical protein
MLDSKAENKTVGIIATERGGHRPSDQTRRQVEELDSSTPIPVQQNANVIARLPH